MAFFAHHQRFTPFCDHCNLPRLLALKVFELVDMVNFITMVSFPRSFDTYSGSVLAELIAHKAGQRAAHAARDGDYQQCQHMELAKMFSLNETLTNRLGAAVLMPPFLVGRALKKYNNGQSIVYYTEGVFAPDTKIRLQSMSDALGVSYSALINRLRELRLLECRPIEEYIDHALFPKASI